jgi:hypothetical protein
MSIPLDRLYHYLDNLSSNDTIIYRWYPHGSKKLNDLDMLDRESAPSSWEEKLTKISMICHDQEPLDYNYYSFESCLEGVREHARKIESNGIEWAKSDNFLKLLASAHLRFLTYSTNFNDIILLCHSEKNSEQLKLYEKNGYAGVYYWSHGLIARDWYRYANHDKNLIPNFDNIKHDFLMYGRAWSGTREYRLTMVDLLNKNQLLSHFNTKFNPHDNNKHYTEHVFVNQSLKIDNNNLENFLALNTSSSESSADYVSQDYQTSGIEVVLETLFDDSRLHLTEKILRPIACGRPFILAGTPGSLNYLREYGFKTFNGLIDESYDVITDPLQRLKAIVEEVKRIAQMPNEQKKKLWSALYTIAEHNKARFFDDAFQQDVVNEFVSNVNQGIQKCKQTMTGKWWKLSHDPAVLGIDVVETEVSKWANKWLENHDKDFSITPSHSSPGSHSI